MISSLSIENYAIIRSLHVDFKSGLNIITGETGAGKSIIVGALNLILGKRADSKVLFVDDTKCIVEGIFDISNYQLQSFFEKNDLDYDDELVIRREINTKGKSRAFVNDTPVKLNVLSELGSHIVDLHQQFATLEIHQPAFQLKVIDQVANNSKLLTSYTKAYKSYKADIDELDRITNAEHNSKKEADYIKFQLNELVKANVQIGEKDKAIEELNRLTHSEDIMKICSEGSFVLKEGDTAVIEILRTLYRSVDSLKDVNKEFSTLAERLFATMEELDDISNELSSNSSNLVFNPEQIISLQDRIDLIQSLEHKHSIQEADGLNILQTELEQRLAGIDDVEGRIKTLKESIAKKSKELSSIAKKLSTTRSKAIPTIEKFVNKLLADLSMPDARLKIDNQTSEEIGSTGVDHIQYLFNSNKGAKMQALKQVASGGELARLNLCIKSLVADKINLPSLVFDEIDTGISGEVAMKMGTVLSDLAKNHQIISITHSPQVASQADEHLFVYKTLEDNQTTTKIKSLSSKEQVIELAKMLSGDPPSKSAISNAKELIGA